MKAFLKARLRRQLLASALPQSTSGCSSAWLERYVRDVIQNTLALIHQQLILTRELQRTRLAYPKRPIQRTRVKKHPPRLRTPSDLLKTSRTLRIANAGLSTMTSTTHQTSRWSPPSCLHPRPSTFIHRWNNIY